MALLAVGLSVWKTAGRGGGAEPAVETASPAVRFIRFGVLAFLVAGFMRVLGSLPPVGNVTDLTWFGPALDQLNAYGFFAMVIFGAAYWIARLIMS